MTLHDVRDDDRMDEALRGLDAADPALTPDQEHRRDALLASLLAESVGESPSGATVLPMRRRRVARWAIPAAAAAALATGIAVHGLSPSGTPAMAYASWTPTAHAVDPASLATAEAACRADMTTSLSRMGDVPASERPTVRPEDARIVVAEQRGNFVFLAMAAPDGSDQQCFFDAHDLGRVNGSTGGWASANSPKPAALGRTGFEAKGGGLSSGPEGTYAFATGRVGSSVRGVTVRTEGRTVTATVNDGYFAAWWPTKDPDGPNRATPAVAYDLTLADGTVRRNVPDGISGTEPGPRQVGGLVTGGGASAEGGGAVRTVAGRVGADVTGVVVRSGARTLPAKVADGTFYVEWPADATGEPPAPTFDLTLRDGTVLRGQSAVK